MMESKYHSDGVMIAQARTPATVIAVASLNFHGIDAQVLARKTEPER